MLANLTAKAKLAIFFGVATLVAGTGVVIHDISTTETIEQITKLRNFDLLGDDKDWKEVLKDYTEQVATKKELKLLQFNGGEDKVEEFKKNCQTMLKIKYRVAESDGTLDSVLWCFKQQTVKDYLTKNKYTPLKTEFRIGTEDNPKWDKKIQEYLKTIPENKMTNLKVEQDSDSEIAESYRTAFIKECENLSKIKHFEEEFEKSYDLSSLWCAEKPKDNES